MRKHLRLLLLCVTGSIILLAFPGASRAQDEPTADPSAEEEEDDQAAKHFAAGRKLYSEAKYKEAIEELLKAYQLRPAPPILLNIARTYEKLENKTEALKYYKEFLQKARLVDPNRPQVEGVVKKLEQEVKVKTGAVTSAAGTDTPETGGGPGEEPKAPVIRQCQQMIHTPVDSAKVNQPITIMVELPPRLDLNRVVLYIRRGGERRFRELPMELQGETYVARIPAQFVTSTSLQYYVRAQKGKGRGRVCAEAGAKTAPHIVVIEGGRAPIVGPRPEIDVKSPYRTWIWVSGAAAVAFLGAGITGAVMAGDRQSAVEKWAKKSCDNCTKPNEIKFTFDDKARDWESEGKTFATLGQVFIPLGIAAAAAGGFLWYMDRKYIKEERARIEREGGPRGEPGPIILGAPWIGAGGGGLMGQISF